jgi:hypothetical protein
MARNWLDFVAGESRHCCLGNGLLLAVVADLILARVGMALAALLYIYRIAETTTVAPVTEENLRDGKAHALHDKEIPPNYAILRIHGPVRDDAKVEDAARDPINWAGICRKLSATRLPTLLHRLCRPAGASLATRLPNERASRDYSDFRIRTGSEPVA